MSVALEEGIQSRLAVSDEAPDLDEGNVVAPDAAPGLQGPFGHADVFGSFRGGEKRIGWFREEGRERVS